MQGGINERIRGSWRCCHQKGQIRRFPADQFIKSHWKFPDAIIVVILITLSATVAVISEPVSSYIAIILKQS